MYQNVFIYILLDGGLRVGYDLDCCLEAVLDLGDKRSKFSQIMIKDMTIYIMNNIRFLSVISPLRELKLYHTMS